MPGRGGFGNIVAVPETKERVTADVEANRQVPNASHQAALPTDTEQPYAHSGRGGAGNYYSPKDLTAKGHFSDAHRSHIVGDGTLAPSESTTNSAPPSYNSVDGPKAEPTRIFGRGGAGNYMFGVSEGEERAAKKKMEEEEQKQQLTAMIEKGVTSGLAMPEQAKLPNA